MFSIGKNAYGILNTGLYIFHFNDKINVPKFTAIKPEVRHEPKGFRKGNIMSIGQNLKNLRKERNITLSDIAKKTDLSLGYLSNLERDLTSPTIEILHKICNILDVTLNDILIPEQSSLDKRAKDASPDDRVSIVREDDRKILFQEGGLSYSSMTRGETDFKVTSMIIADDETYRFSEHDHDELGIVSEGILELIIDGKSYFLHPGDTIYIKSGTMHSGRKAGEGRCVSSWVKLSSYLNDLSMEQKKKQSPLSV